MITSEKQRSSAQTTAAAAIHRSCCAVLLLLLCSRPTVVGGFVVTTPGNLFGIRGYANDAAAAAFGWGESSRSSSSCGSSSSSSSSSSSRTSRKPSGCMFMGASRDDHTDRKDQWEGWDMEESGAAEEEEEGGDAVSFVCGRRACFAAPCMPEARVCLLSYLLFAILYYNCCVCMI